MDTIRVLGIDPGLTRCGIGIVDVARNRSATLVHVGVVRSAITDEPGQRLATIAAGIRAVLDEFAPDAVAVERVFAQQNLSTVMGTAQASGVALMLGAERGLPTATHTPSEVKAAITGYGSAEKLQVQTMVARVLRLEELPKPADAADALAIALCHAWRTPFAVTPPASRPGTVAAAPAAGTRAGGLTPAQRAWAAAEKRSKR